MSVSTFTIGPKARNTEVLKVTASDVSGSDSGFSACGSVSTSGDSPNTTVTGGSGSYTYSWAQTGAAAEAGPFVINNSTTQNPVWDDIRCDMHLDNNENWTVTVTDTVTGKTAATTISVTLVWINIS